jgi:hypothetical protein
MYENILEFNDNNWLKNYYHIDIDETNEQWLDGNPYDLLQAPYGRGC